jgi:hypothetical protein
MPDELFDADALIDESMQAAAEAAPPGSPSWTKAEMNAYLQSLTHDDLKELPAWNAQLSRHINRSNEQVTQYRTRAEQAERQLAMEQAKGWATYFNSLTAEQFAQEMKDPARAKIFTQVQEILTTPQQPSRANPNAAALRDALQADPDWGDVLTDEVWQQMQQANDPVAAVKTLLSAGKSKFTRAEKAEIGGKLDELAAQKHGQAFEPVGGGGNGTSMGPGLTMERYMRMSPEEAARLPDHAIDEMFARERDSLFR